MNKSKREELIFWLLILFLTAFPLRDGFVHGAIVGSGPDVVSTLWGMWWFQQERAPLGGESFLFNYPYGGIGNILSPSSSVLWAVLEPLVGIGRAAAAAAWLQIVGFCLGVYLLTGSLIQHQYARWAAVCVPLVGRYFVFGMGEGSLVAVAAIPLPLGLWALFETLRKTSWPFAAFAAFCMVWMGVENPYLAPILPCVALYLMCTRAGAKSQVGAAVLVGSVGILWVASILGKGANPEYPRESANQLVEMFSRQWSVVDLPWARLSLTEIFWPETVKWTLSSDSAVEAGGGRYLGCSVLALSFFALALPQARIWFVFGLIGWLLSLGSLCGGFAVPFLFLNNLMDHVARPLTQPTRFLIVVVLSQAVLIGFLVEELIRSKFPVPYWLPVLFLIFTLDAVLLGGLQLKPPSTALPQYDCNQKLDDPTLVWPADATDGEKGRAQLYQMLHGAPAAHTGIASWGLLSGRVEPSLRSAGFRVGASRVQLQILAKQGYRWLIVEKETGFPSVFLRPVESCGAVDLYDLSALRGPLRAVEGR